MEALEVWCREEMHYPRYGFDLHKEALDLHSHRMIRQLGGWGGLTIYLSTGGSAGGGGRRRFPKIRVDCCNREISEVTEESLRRDMAPCLDAVPSAAMR